MDSARGRRPHRSDRILRGELADRAGEPCRCPALPSAAKDGAAPYYGTWTTFTVDICVFKSGTHQFSAVVDNFNWKTSGWYGSPPIYDAVVLQIQLKWDGDLISKRSCNFTSIVHRHRITFPGDPHRCVLGEWFNIWGDTSITADGKLTYNWNNDGKGNFYWRWKATSALHPG